MSRGLTIGIMSSSLTYIRGIHQMILGYAITFRASDKRQDQAILITAPIMDREHAESLMEVKRMDAPRLIGELVDVHLVPVADAAERVKGEVVAA